MKKILILIVFVMALIVVLPLFLLVVPVIMVASSSQDNQFGFVMCNEGAGINYSMWSDRLSKAGALANAGDSILRVSSEHNLDPVLFAAIAIHETANGTSNGIVNYNNPGGLMDPATNWQRMIRFDSLESGLNSMAKTLHRLIYDEGLVTINDLGSSYAPLGAENDPNGLNVHWVPRVTEYANELGGLIMNCEMMGEVELIGDRAWVVPHTKNITSYYGPRSCSGCSSFHRGIDVAGPGIHGTPVVSFMDGIVIASTSQGTTFHSSAGNMGSGYGYYVAIDHGNGIETRYAHLARPGIPVGSQVRAGEVIGVVGSTGGSTGSHLHFEIVVSGTKVDPMPYLKDFVNKR